jgi:Uma2 family endonuclease
VRSKTAHLEPHTDFLWSREDYEELVRLDVFGPEDRIELLNGKLITMAPQKTAHAISYNLARKYLDRVFESGFDVRPQFPLVLDDRSEPEPDVAVVRGEVRDYSDHHPTAADTVLLVEVSDSSLDYERTDKLAAYARGGVPEYWILNLVDRVLEVYRKPAGDSYGEKRTLGADDPVAPLGCEDQAVSVSDLLP